MEEKLAQKIINKTTVDYNLIASEFSSKREYLSDDILYFKKYIQDNDNILDFGCGNGRLVDLFDKTTVNYQGVDISENLIKIARERHPHYKFDTIKKIPLDFKEESFNKIFALAVFHHIPSSKKRLEYLNELKRVLKEGGIVVLTVWHIPYEKVLQYEKVSTGEDDVLVPFKNSAGKSLADRFFHIFSKDKLEEFVKSAGLKIVESRFLSRGNRGYGNLCIIVEKVEKSRLKIGN